MTLERRNPLPAGIYWQDFFSPAVGASSQPTEAFVSWVSDNAEAVKVRSSVQHEPDSDGRVRTWMLFQVLAPVAWPAGFGVPTVAERGAATDEQDTVQRPDPVPDPLDQIDWNPKAMGGLLENLAYVGVGLFALIAAKELFGRKGRA